MYEACNFIRDIIFNFSFQDLSIGGKYLKAGGCLSESESRVSFRFQFHETRSVSYFRFQNIQADVILSPLILFRSIIFLFSFSSSFSSNILILPAQEILKISKKDCKRLLEKNIDLTISRWIRDQIRKRNSI